MANWSSTDISISGTKSNMDAFKYNLSKCVSDFNNDTDTGDTNTLDNASYIYDDERQDGMTVDQITISDTDISIQGQGRWSAPADLFKELFEQHNLSGYVEDSEPGNDFFYRAEYDNGIQVSRDNTLYFSKASYDALGEEYFIDHYQWLTEDPEENKEELQDIADQFIEFGSDKDEIYECFEIKPEQSRAFKPYPIKRKLKQY